MTSKHKQIHNTNFCHQMSQDELLQNSTFQDLALVVESLHLFWNGPVMLLKEVLWPKVSENLLCLKATGLLGIGRVDRIAWGDETN